MLNELELDRLHDQLAQFRAQSTQRVESEQAVLLKYHDLLEAYRRLRSDFEEEREARERYKKLARGQERNQFVLLLLDLDGYIFNDHLVKAGKDGGTEAAKLLKAAMADTINSLGEDADRCRVIFRGYANLQGLSVVLARSGLAGKEARSLAPFASSFTRSEELFDIIDAGEKRESIEQKIMESFRLFADSSQCRHIYFGGCHDATYLSLLAPYRGRTDKVTLIRAAAFQAEYHDLSLRVVEFPAVFRSQPLEAIHFVVQSSPSLVSPLKSASTPKTNNSLKNGSISRKLCIHFQNGHCRNGDACRFSHSMNQPRADQKNNDTFEKQQLRLADDWNAPFKYEPPVKRERPARNEIPAKNDANGKGPRQVAHSLPSEQMGTAGLLPVNRSDERLDTYLAPPSTEQWDRFYRRISEKKLCNRHHLLHVCSDTETCQYDHRPIDSDILHTLRFVARSIPCPKQGACRSRSCINGHICQKDGCSGGSGCKFPNRLHLVEPIVEQWLDPLIDISDDENQDNTYSILSTPSLVGITVMDRFTGRKW